MMGKRCGRGYTSEHKQCRDRPAASSSGRARVNGAVELTSLERNSKGEVRYRGRWWKPNQPVKASQKNKKRQVLATKRVGKKTFVKVVSYGHTGYSHNYSSSAKQNYLKRSAGIKNKSGQPTKDDPFSPNHWARKDLWSKKLPADGSTKYKVDATHEEFVDNYADSFFGALRENKFDAATASTPQDAAKILVRQAIASIYPKIRNIISLKLEKKVFTGFFSDTDKKGFKFELKPGGKLNYTQIDPSQIRSDAEGDKCSKGTDCGDACVKSGSKCEIGLGSGAQRMAELAVQTWETEQIPTRKEIAGAVGAVARDVLRNPVKAVKEGLEREKKVREAIESTGVKIPSKLNIMGAALKLAGKKSKEYVENNPEMIKEAAIAIGGTVASSAGGAVGGPVGKYAADLAGAMLTRKGIKDYERMQKAKTKLEQDEAYQAAGRLKKIAMVRDEMLSDMRSEESKKKAENDVVGDVAGWAIGNVTGDVVIANTPVLNNPILGNVGYAVPIKLTPLVVEAHNRVKDGENAADTLKDIYQREAGKAVREGNAREQRAREAASNLIRETKAKLAEQAEKAARETAQSAIKTVIAKRKKREERDAS